MVYGAEAGLILTVGVDINMEAGGILVGTEIRFDIDGNTVDGKPIHATKAVVVQTLADENEIVVNDWFRVEIAVSLSHFLKCRTHSLGKFSLINFDAGVVDRRMLWLGGRGVLAVDGVLLSLATSTDDQTNKQAAQAAA